MSEGSVLFVCLGNICRSPTGEGVFRAYAEAHARGDALVIDSAGTIAYHEGKPADARMRRAASARGYELTSRARKITAEDLERFALVVAMDRENERDIQELCPPGARAEIRLLSSFLPDGEAWPIDVPDPYYGGASGFETVLDMIEAACPALLEHASGSK